MKNFTYSDNNLSEKTLLKYILKDNKSKSKKNIEKYFNLNANSKKKLISILNHLIKENMITKVKRNFYGSIIPLNKKIVFMVTKIYKNKIFSLPLKYKGKFKDLELFLNDSNYYLIESLQVGQKFYGTVDFDPTSKYSITFIKNIDTQNSELIIGVLNFRNKKFYIQRNELLNKSIEIIPDNVHKIESGQLVKVKLIKQRKVWKAKVFEIIGTIDSLKSLNKYIEQKYDLPLTFSTQVEIEAQNLSKIKINDKNREDYREIDFITVDPDDAMDHDDAIWASKDTKSSNKNGWIIKIAIADVSFYVKENSLIDREALKRCFSLYFPNKVIPMLPFNLSNNLCSLKSGKDRPALVLHIIIDSNGKITSYKFRRAVINVSANLTYKVFNNLIRENYESKKYNHLKQTVSDLLGSYNSLKHMKKTRSPLEIYSQEPKFIIKDDKLNNIIQSENLESHNLVEEFMITANSCAANYLINSKIKTLFRVHEKPTTTKMKQFKKILKNLNIEFHNEEETSTNFFNQI
ncbi:MAG: Ribonuclease R, partial [Alphaproteobacteria bacterium MarineAlpha2_Bin1]